MINFHLSASKVCSPSFILLASNILIDENGADGVTAMLDNKRTDEHTDNIDTYDVDNLSESKPESHVEWLRSV